MTFKYDPLGRRIEKQIVNSFNGDTITKTVNYIYDAEDIVLQIEEVTHDSTTTTTETRFIHGPGIDEPLAFARDGQSYFYHADGLGSIVAITDSTQAIAQKYSYESFGLPTPQTTLQQPYLFTSREWDAEIGLYFYRARYYDPMEGRFISEDPIGIVGNLYTQGLNIVFYQYVEAILTPYLYTRNSPVNSGDPTGLYVGGVGVGVSGAIGSGNFIPSISFSGSLMVINDGHGNWGVAVCGGAGAAAGVGVIGGVQTSNMWGADSICDLEKGPSVAVGGGFAAGPGGAAETSADGINAITGVGVGGWGGAAGAGGCKILFSW